MANRYWVGGIGIWDSSTTFGWSATPGGPSGASAPTAADDVYFDRPGAYVISVDPTAVCASLTVSNGFYSFIINAPTIHGSVNFTAGTVADGFVLLFGGTASRTIRTNGVKCSRLFCLTGATITLGSDLTLTDGLYTFTNGSTLNLSSYSLNVSAMWPGPTSTYTLDFNSGTINVNAGGTSWSTGSSTGIIKYGPDAKLFFRNGSTNLTFVGGTGKKYPVTYFFGTGINTINANSTFEGFYNDSAIPQTFKFLAGSTNSFKGFSLKGSAGSLCTITSTGVTPATLQKITDWNVGSNSVNGGNNTGLTFYGTAPNNYLNISYITGIQTQNRYWVGGTGTWDATSTSVWSATSGGAGGASVPTFADNVYFTAIGTYTVTVADDTECGPLTVNNGLYTFAGYAPTVNGNIYFATGTVAPGFNLAFGGYTGPGDFYYLTTNGAVCNRLFCLTRTTIKLSGSLTLTNGISTFTNGAELITDNYSLTIGGMLPGSTSTYILNLGSSAITVTGSGTVWSTGSYGATIAYATMASITFTGSSNITFVGGDNKKYPTLNFTGAGTVTVNANSFFEGISSSYIGSKDFRFATGSVNSFKNFNLNGTPGNFYTITSSTQAGQATLKKPNGWVVRNSVDEGNNTGIVFSNDGTLDYLRFSWINGVSGQNKYWVGGTNTWNLYSTSTWSDTPGGPSGATPPSPIDPVVFSQSGDFTITVLSGVECGGITVTVGFYQFVGSTPIINGNVFFATNSVAPGLPLVFSGTGSYTVITNNISCSKLFCLTGATINLGGPLVLTDGLNTFTNGSVLNTFNQALTVGGMLPGPTSTYTLNLGSSAITVTGGGTSWSTGSTNGMITYYFGASIKFTTPSANILFNGGIGKKYPPLIFTGSGMVIINSNATFENISCTYIGPKTFKFTSGTTNTFGDFNLSGTAGNLYTITSTTGTSAATLKKATNWYVGANSVNGGNNTGLYFSSGVIDYLNISWINGITSENRYWVGGTGTWDATSTSVWSATSGGAGGASVPTLADDVYFDQLGTYTITGTASIECASLAVSAGSYTFQTYGPVINGNFSINSTTVWNTAVLLQPPISSTCNITVSGTTINGDIKLLTSAYYVLKSALTVTGLFLFNQGTLTTDDYNITMGAWSSSNLNTRTFNMGLSNITVTGSGSVWNMVFGTNAAITYDIGASITFTSSSSVTFSGGSLNYPAVSHTGGGQWTINGSNIFQNISSSYIGAKTIRFAPTVHTFYNFSLSGGGSYTYTITSTTGTATFKKSTNWYVGANSINNGNNTGLIFANGGGVNYLNISGINGITFQNKYWVGGTGTWSVNSTSGWSDTSNGPSGALPPAYTDMVYFDKPGPYTITCIPGITCKTINVSAGPYLFVGSTPTVYGSVIFAIGAVSSPYPLLSFGGTGFCNILTNGTICTRLVCTSGANINILSALTVTTGIQTFTNNSVLNTGGQSLTVGAIAPGVNSSYTLNLSSSTITITGGGTVWSTSSINGKVLFNSETTINFTTPSSSITFVGGDKNYPAINFIGSGLVTINANSLFENISCTYIGAKTFKFISGSKNTFKSFSLSGTAGNLYTITSTTGTSAATLKKATDWYVGANSVDSGNNTGLTFAGGDGIDYLNLSWIDGIPGENRYWVGGTNTWNLYSTSTWSATSGGSSGASVPTAVDNAFFDQAGTYTITGTEGIECRSLSVGVGTYTFQTYSPVVYGNFSIAANTFWNVNVQFQATSGAYTLVTNGAIIYGSITFLTSAIYTLGNELTVTGSIKLLKGTLSTNNYNISMGIWESNTSNVRTFNIGASAITVSTHVWYMVNGTNATITYSPGAIISFTGAFLTFNGGSLTYPEITHSGSGEMAIYGSNTFEDISSSYVGPKVIKFASGAQNIFKAFSLSGTLGNLYTLTTTSSEPTLLQKINGGEWYVGINSINRGNNFGVKFEDGDGIDYLSVSNIWVPGYTSTGAFITFFV